MFAPIWYQSGQIWAQSDNTNDLQFTPMISPESLRENPTDTAQTAAFTQCVGGP